MFPDSALRGLLSPSPVGVEIAVMRIGLALGMGWKVNQIRMTLLPVVRWRAHRWCITTHTRSMMAPISTAAVITVRAVSRSASMDVLPRFLFGGDGPWGLARRR